MTILKLEKVFGPASQNRIAATDDRTIEGALAAVESFYYSFNQKDLHVLKKLWYCHDLVQLNNPVGGIVRGIDPILLLYGKIFNSNAKVWVQFTDIVCYFTRESVVFTGTELGQFTEGDKILSLKIRTTRVFNYSAAEHTWYQVHHHGSIDDPALLSLYQASINK